MAPSPSARAPLFGTGAKLMPKTSAATSTTDRIPPRLSTGSVVSLTWLGTKRRAMSSATTASGSVIRKTELPVELLEQRARDQWAESSDGATDAGPQRDRLRAGGTRPQRRNQGERRRKGHARRKPADHACYEEHPDRRSECREHARGDRQRHATDQHQLTPVAVTERAQIEHRGGKPERVAHGHEVERRLPRIERLADVRQRDVSHRQVEVGDRRYQDERDEDEPRTLGCGRGVSGRGRRHASMLVLGPSANLTRSG